MSNKKNKTTENPTAQDTAEAAPEVEKTIVEPKVVEVNYQEKFQRLQAEFANYEKRTEKEKVELLNNANVDLISQLLEVLDNFDLALKHNKDEGVIMIHQDLLKILEKQGLKTISVEGKFNPEFHEAIIQEEGEKDGVILEEFQKGYLLNEKLIRASKVKISTLKK